MSPQVLLDVGGTNTWTEAPYSVLPKSITHRPGKDSNLNLSFSPCTSLSPWEYRKSSGENIKTTVQNATVSGQSISER